MGKYSDYNIIPLGDHCAISTILNELNLRHNSYPFDWNSHKDQLYNTNIIYNIQLIKELILEDNVDNIVQQYIGDAFDNNEKMNSNNQIWFPHDSGNLTEIAEKYKRRFCRLKQDMHKKNIFILLTRHYYIEKDVFQTIHEQLLSYNSDSIILFISGTNHTYFEDMNYTNVITNVITNAIPNVIFTHIEYDISKFCDYDYSMFRPNIRKYLSNLLL